MHAHSCIQASVFDFLLNFLFDLAPTLICCDNEALAIWTPT